MIDMKEKKMKITALEKSIELNRCLNLFRSLREYLYSVLYEIPSDHILIFSMIVHRVNSVEIDIY